MIPPTVVAEQRIVSAATVIPRIVAEAGIERVIVVAEGRFCALAHVVAVNRLVTVPSGLRELLKHRPHLRSECGRTHRTGKEAQACALLCFLAQYCGANLACESVPG